MLKRILGLSYNLDFWGSKLKEYAGKSECTGNSSSTELQECIVGLSSTISTRSTSFYTLKTYLANKK